jgi:hypothetical protein
VGGAICCFWEKHYKGQIEIVRCQYLTITWVIWATAFAPFLQRDKTRLYHLRMKNVTAILISVLSAVALTSALPPAPPSAIFVSCCCPWDCSRNSLSAFHVLKMTLLRRAPDPIQFDQNLVVRNVNSSACSSDDIAWTEEIDD